MSAIITYEEWMKELGECEPKRNRLKTNALLQGVAWLGSAGRSRVQQGLARQGKDLELLQPYKRPFKEPGMK